MSKFEVGSKVIMGSLTASHVYTVEKITPAGYLKVMGNLYRPISEDRAIERGGTRVIRLATDELLAELDREKFVREMTIRIRGIHHITYEQAKAIAEILGIKED